MHHSILACSLALGAVGCAGGSYRFQNTSADRVTHSSGPPIRARVRVVDPETASGSAIGSDVRNLLRSSQTFTEVDPNAHGSGGLVLEVRSRHKESSMGGAIASGVGKGVLNGLASGLTFGIVSSTSDWTYDYWVVLSGVLACNGAQIGEYTARGSFEAQLPDSAPLSQKQDEVRQAVAKSYEHAFSVLISKLKEDRNRIESSGCQTTESRSMASASEQEESEPPTLDRPVAKGATASRLSPGRAPVQGVFDEPNYGPNVVTAPEPEPKPEPRPESAPEPEAPPDAAPEPRRAPAVASEPGETSRESRPDALAAAEDNNDPIPPAPELRDLVVGDGNRSERRKRYGALSYHLDRVKAGFSDTYGHGLEGYGAFVLTEREKLRVALGPVAGISAYGDAVTEELGRSSMSKLFAGLRFDVLGKRGRLRYGAALVGQASRWRSDGWGGANSLEARALGTLHLLVSTRAFLTLSGGYRLSPTLYEFSNGFVLEPIETRGLDFSVGLGFE